MKRIFEFLAIAAAVGIAHAEGLSPYVRVAPGAMFAESAHVSSGPYPAGSKIDFDPGLIASVAVGVAHENAPIRAELEYDFVKYYSDEANFTGFSDGNKLVWHVYMANLYYDFHNDSLFTPFVTAGLGAADVEDGVDTVFAYQLGGGLEFETTEKISLDLSYRYFSVEDPEIADASGNYKAGFAVHQLMLGVRSRF